MRAIVKKDKMSKLRLRLAKVIAAAEVALPYGCPQEVLEGLRDADSRLAAAEAEFLPAAVAEAEEKAEAIRARAAALNAKADSISVSVTTGPPTEITAEGNAPN